MPFKKITLENWKTQTHQSDLMGFGDYTNFRFGDHPFKISMVSCDAPTLTLPTNTVNPTFTNSFNLVVKVSKGYVYDLNRLLPNTKMPLHVSKRRDGSFVFIQGKQKLNFGDAQLAQMRVPVDISNSYSLTIKTKGGFVDVSQGNGMLFFEVVFRDVTNIVGNLSSRIESASILTDVQLKAKYNGVVIDRFGAVLPPRFKNTVRTFVFYNPEVSRYMCINSANSTFTKKLPLPDPSTYSEEFKKQLAIENAGGGSPFHFTFIPQPFLGQTVKNDLFLRIPKDV